MTPFGLRRRLRGLLSEPEAPRVRLLLRAPAGEEAELLVPAGLTLSEATAASRWPMLTRCEDGRCGGCVVEDLGGAGLSAPEAPERAAAGDNGAGRALDLPRERLACQARVEADARVGLRATWTLEDVIGAGPPLPPA